jgi:high affinity sulfate transporter 1
MNLFGHISRIAPGLPRLLAYRCGNFRHDLVAGLAVAAVALPVGVAYAQLAGFNPVIGLYASILPLVAYALFGTSRQLIVGPDAATCALVAAAVAPLAGGDQALYLSLSLTLTFLAGVLCLAGCFLRLGALADFLSKPILVGFLNGTALSIMLGQIGKILGFTIEADGIVGRLMEIVAKFESTHWPTLAVGLATFALLAAAPRLLPSRLPAGLVAMAGGALAVVVLGLEAQGVQTVGPVPAGLPPLHIPAFPPQLLPELLANAAGLALVSYTSMTLTARSFAAKNHYEVDADQEFAALGVANIAAALSQGFAVSGADSRTAMSDASGGRTQMTGLIAALTVALVVLFFTHPLQYVPIAALGAVLVHAAMSLLDITTLRQLYRIDWREFLLSILATLGVVAVGAINAILFAVVLALIRFIQALSRPRTEVLGEVAGHPGFHAIARHHGATTIPGLVILRFNGPLVFFNAAYFKHQVLRAAEAAGADLKWFVLDMLPVTMIDSTGMYAAEEVFGLLRRRGIVIVAAGRKTEWEEWVKKRDGLVHEKMLFYPTLRQAVKACKGGTEKGVLTEIREEFMGEGETATDLT